MYWRIILFGLVSFLYLLGRKDNADAARLKRLAAECYQCNSVSSNDQCTNIQQCPNGDSGGCQTEVRTDGQGNRRISKKCKNLSVCLQEEQQFASQCTGHDVPQSICYYCCEDDLCNKFLPGEEPLTTTTTTTTPRDPITTHTFTTPSQ